MTRLASCILILFISVVCHGAPGVAVFGSFVKESGARDFAEQISDRFDIETNLRVTEINGRNYYRVVSDTRLEGAGRGVKATAYVQGQTIIVEGKLPFALKLFARKIESVVAGKLQRMGQQ